MSKVTNTEVIRLYNEYGSTASNVHAMAIDSIMNEAMESIIKYIEANNVCSRDTTGYCISNVESNLAVYTLRRAMKMKKERDALSKIL